MRKIEKPPDFYVGDRVAPKDKSALWSRPGVSLTVVRSYLCESPALKGQEVIVLEVRWSGKPTFQANQFARDYEQVPFSNRYPQSSRPVGHTDADL